MTHQLTDLAKQEADLLFSSGGGAAFDDVAKGKDVGGPDLAGCHAFGREPRPHAEIIDYTK
ncbi:hypothetical protein [Plantactinospora mayteni]|uniref:hypothetical protein n=1 Tax=Plantactinospora mayteni TaxID=566021 RepID=UPI001944467D|nr:hypothetical protein [Plantactinospora mayteni]